MFEICFNSRSSQKQPVDSSSRHPGVMCFFHRSLAFIQGLIPADEATQITKVQVIIRERYVIHRGKPSSRNCFSTRKFPEFCGWFFPWGVFFVRKVLKHLTGILRSSVESCENTGDDLKPDSERIRDFDSCLCWRKGCHRFFKRRKTASGAVFSFYLPPTFSSHGCV